MRFEDLLGRWEAGTLSQTEAAAALGVSERTFRRWRGRHAEDGAAGLVDRRVGQPSPRRAPADELQRMLKLYHEYYAGFAIRHFHDRLRRRHGYTLGYTTTRLRLQKSGAVAAAPKRGAHRKKRPRRAPRRPFGRRPFGYRIGLRPKVGMMLHQDGSTHAWLVGQPALDLVITPDDATSAIYSASPVVALPRPFRGWIGGPRPPMVEEEGTAATFRGLAEVIERHGLFIELYTDRAQRARSDPAGTAAKGRRRAATTSIRRRPAGRSPRGG
jgi:transposase